MARGVNKVILIGNLGNDPDVRYMPSGGAVVNISLATSDSWKDKQSGERVERTEWHRVVFFNRLAEIVGEYLKKGKKVYVEGRLQTRKYQDREGVERYTTEIVANEMQLLDSRGGGGSAAFDDSPSSGAAGGPPAQTPTRPSGGEARPAGSGPAAGTGDAEDFDDDIPF